MSRVKNNIDHLKEKIASLETELINTKHEYQHFVEKTNEMLKNLNKQDESIEIKRVARDITLLKKTKEELIKAKDIAERSLDVKRRFLTNMSHEIRNLMNGIIGMIELLATTKLDKNQSDYVKIINNSSQTLLNILNDILDLSKIEAKKMKLRLNPLQLVKTIEKVYSLFSQQASSKNNNLYYHIDKKLPNWILGDETRLIQIISNLISNAIKFSKDKGNINLSVDLLEKRKEQLFLKVSIKDSGIGISKNDQQSLFQNFHQIDTCSSKNYSGTGLGLAISSELVKYMNGEIDVISTPGLGSTFWFTFQTKEISENQIEISTHDNPFSKQFTSQQPSILLVDDNDINRKVASGIMIKFGCKVQEAFDGFHAIEKAKLVNFDLIFMDIQMPKMDGITTMRKIKKLKNHSTTPIIAMTAYAMEEDSTRFIKAGLDDYLAKPINAQSIINKIQQWVNFKPWGVSSDAIIEKGDYLVINQNTLNQFAKIGGQEFIKEILTDFEKEAQKLIVDIEKYLKKREYKKMQEKLHTLKGNAGTLGVEKLAKQTSIIDFEIKENNFEKLANEVRQLSLLFHEFKKNSQNLLTTNS